ncbi:MAG: hypothetical protein L0H00_10755, partial [Micrococcales bacterium]|nr:hypothetical protein [Micrococcales bacterium]
PRPGRRRRRDPGEEPGLLRRVGPHPVVLDPEMLALRVPILRRGVAVAPLSSLRIGLSRNVGHARGPLIDTA